jgi:nitrite reductase/ring-hydroxylating ferredoxin subunit
VSTRKLLLARTDELPPGSTKKFTIEMGGRRVEAFVANFHGRYVAFINRCVHLPIALDLDDNDFFSCDGNFFVCKTHGSVYEPGSGRCIGGPGQGKSLEPLPVTVENGAVYVELAC